MKTLDEIAIEFGTDKASKHPTIKGHNYAVHYDKHFTPIREDVLKVLEVGVGGGESIQTWLEYFPNAKVFGVDIVNSTNPWNTVDAPTHERYKFVTGDQSSDVFWKCFVADYGSHWDIIIDDGGHLNYQIITTFNSMWNHIRAGGLYCVEDLAVGYGDGSVFVRSDFPRHMEFVGQLMDKINFGQDECDSLYFCQELAILRKKNQ
jgi:hypothetical protein